MISNVIKPKKPMPGSRWVLVHLDQDQHGNDRYYYTHPEGFVAISALEVADGIIRREYIPQYHLSISKDKKRRCSSQDAKFILKQFGLDDALEDNHVHSGFVRNFWLPVDENKQGRECECVADEVAIKEDKGDFIWRPAHH
ncbi:hypothetical protein [Acinetobacter variabilis]|uniref:Uncharacterized protein n=2 Tax=Acinetobacter variabilis TaxID=70346 RepID=N8VN14_9GAMM|nr:hypothetical protein [Acinetobacter variabilis]ENV00921.1 hypothetical protein F969_00068 [Acinetobacter variabilis]